MHNSNNKHKALLIGCNFADNKPPYLIAGLLSYLNAKGVNNIIYCTEDPSGSWKVFKQTRQDILKTVKDLENQHEMPIKVYADMIVASTSNENERYFFTHLNNLYPVTVANVIALIPTIEKLKIPCFFVKDSKIDERISEAIEGLNNEDTLRTLKDIEEGRIN